MFELSGVSVAYGSRSVLSDVTVTLGPDPVAIMGPSGSGKSTLLSLLAGHRKPDKGSIRLNGVPVRTGRGGSSDSRVAFVHQDYRLVEFLSVAENLRLACELRGGRASDSAIAEAATMVGLAEVDLARKPETLSGGEQQRVAIARALLCDAAALVADEPTGALDVDTTTAIATVLLRTASTAGLALVLATHDPVVADLVPARLILSGGTVRAAA